ncbi:MAG: Oxygen-independent coproporphyrinogen-III oxidase 2 [Candidatus Aminicenantes bacterium ADurb.Bin508]|nr:MAG: Oxygen-independent coproporphyrinogen-III oxidase 2 [Candidatus Aminicenantes bacterium ADurb.Bin508]
MAPTSFPFPEGWYPFSQYLKGIFRVKVRKIPLSLPGECPNKDGRIGSDGCIFCDPLGSGPTNVEALSLREQYMKARAHFLSDPKGVSLFLAYLQSNTNTDRSAEELRTLMSEMLSFPDLGGISLSTRPDCLNRDHLELFQEYSQKIPLWIELGLQTVHLPGLLWLRRRHSLGDFLAAFTALQERKIKTCVHIILGIPGEGEREVVDTALFLSALRPDTVKVHPLHVLRGSDLERLYASGEYTPLERSTYLNLAVAFLEHLDPSIAVQRLTGDREGNLFVAPLWAERKRALLADLMRLLRERKTHQGRLVDLSVHRPFRGENSFP